MTHSEETVFSYITLIFSIKKCGCGTQYGTLTVFVMDILDQEGEGRKIRISKNGTLNIYFAVDISESMEAEHINNARKAITTLISKVRNKQLSSQNNKTLYGIFFLNGEGEFSI